MAEKSTPAVSQGQDFSANRGSAPSQQQHPPQAGKADSVPARVWAVRYLALALALAVFLGAGYFAWLALRTEYNFQSAEKAIQQRDFGLARRYLLANVAHSPNSARERFLLARIARHVGNFEEAEEQLERCQRIEGATSRIALERSLLQVQQGGITYLAEVQLRYDLKQEHPEAEQILEALSLGCLTSYRFGSAVDYLTAWLERSPADHRIYLWRSQAYEHLSDFAAAREDARQAVSLDPDNSESHLRLAQALLRTTEYQEAAEIFGRLSEDGDPNPAVAMGYAQAKAKLGLTEEASQLLDKLAAKFPNDPPTLIERGRLALQMGQAAEAERWLRRAVAVAPWDYEINYNLLLSLQAQAKKKEVETVGALVRRLSEDSARFTDLTRQMNQNPYDLYVRCEIGRVYLGEGNDKQAVQWLKSVLKVDASHPLANQLLAEYYERSGQPALAAPHRKYAGDSPGAGPPVPP
jgi:Tfp pilus assembly protein PilF